MALSSSPQSPAITLVTTHVWPSTPEELPPLYCTCRSPLDKVPPPTHTHYPPHCPHTHTHTHAVPPTVSVHPREIWTVVGGSFALSCSGSQWPLAWYRAHQTVESLPGHTQLCDDTLLVEGVAGPGVLEYSCVATSPYGNSTSYATVTITSKWMIRKSAVAS